MEVIIIIFVLFIFYIKIILKIFNKLLDFFILGPFYRKLQIFIISVYNLLHLNHY